MCERGRAAEGAHESGGAAEGGPGFTHSVVICSSCFHTGGILRLLVSISLSGVELRPAGSGRALLVQLI